MATKASRKIRTPEQKLHKLARRLLPAVQVANDRFAIVDVANHSDADQRHMVRSAEKETIRRLTRVEKLRRAGTIAPHEAEACQWYANVFAMGYDTIGCTADYQGSGVRGGRGYCLASQYAEQQEARTDYGFARSAIPPDILPMFEKVVLMGEPIADASGAKGRALERATAIFRLGANLLHGRIAHRLEIAN